MTVMKIWGMRVAVAQWLMLMAMTVGAPWRIRGDMIMLVVLIVLVRVLMYFVHVQMMMAVSFAEMKPQSDRHEHARDSQRPRERFAENHGHGGANEWSDREIGTRASAAQVTQRQNEQDEAESITEQANDQGANDRPTARPVRAERDRQDDDYSACHRPLDCHNQQGIRTRHGASTRVVDAPTQARGDNRCCSPPRRGTFQPWGLRPGQDRATGDDDEHTQYQSAVGVLTHHQPREQTGEHAFEIQ